MKRIICTSLLCFLFCAACLCQNAGSLEAFDWLEGTWEKVKTKPGETAYEIWTRDPAGFLSGTGFTLRGSDTVFVEQLRIIQQEGAFYYVAIVSHNPAPVMFRITEAGPTSFVSENLKHDFPKMISYAYDGEILMATISAGEKEIPFLFRKKE